MDSAITLGIDSATGGCSAAVIVQGRVLAIRRRTMERGQAECLMPTIAETLEAAGIAPAGIGRIGVTTGPGVFTGVRLGLASARCLALLT